MFGIKCRMYHESGRGVECCVFFAVVSFHSKNVITKLLCKSILENNYHFTFKKIVSQTLKYICRMLNEVLKRLNFSLLHTIA